MSGLAALGSFAGGFSNGMMDGQIMQDRQKRMSLADADMKWQHQQRDRQQQQWARDDQDRELMNAARAAGSKVVQDDMAAYDQAPPPPGGLDGRTGMKKPWSPSRNSILQAADAEIRELFIRGRSDIGRQKWNDLEPLRASQRAETARDLYMAMQSGADVTEPMRNFYRSIGDGRDIDGKVDTVQGPNGPAYHFRLRNEFSGVVGEKSRAVPQQEILESLALALTEPKQIAEHAWQRFMEAFKADQGIRRDAAKEKDERETKATEHGYRRAEIAAAGAEARTTKATPSASDKAFTLWPDQTRFETLPGGTSVEVAKGAPKSGGHAEALGLLREERLAAQSEVTALTNRLRVTQRPDRPALVARIEEAQRRARAIGDKISAYGDEKRGPGGASTGGARAMTMPRTRGELKAGTVYETARGRALWNGREFEAQ